MAEEPKSKLQQFQEQARSLIDDQAVAMAEHRQFTRARAFVHFWVLVGRSFVRNRCPVRASALSYSSLLAMIPMLALMLSITTSFLKSQGEKPIRAFVEKMVEYVTPYISQEDVTGADNDLQARAREEAARAREEAVRKINEFIDKTQTGAIGATSAILLMFVAISMLSRIEATFNDIWGVARSRPWYVQIMLYWSMITLGPLALISALGLATTGQLHFSSSPTLGTSDLRVTPELLARLQAPRDPLDAVVVARLSETARPLLAGPLTATNRAALQNTLVAELNRIVEGTRLVEEGSPAAANLTAATRRQLGSDAHGPALQRLNRRILEDVFPNEITRSAAIRWPVIQWIAEIPLVQSLISTYLPALVLSVGFALVYLWLPNTKVQFSAALMGGLTAGLLWHLNNKLSVLFVSRVTSNNAVYGSLGMVPVFMIGMYFCWLILLFGAQVGYVYQNRRAYLQERLAEGVHHRGREFAALRLMTEIARRFHRGEKPPSLAELAAISGVPTRLGSQLLGLLAKARLLYEVYEREVAYAPARPLHQISVQEVLDAIRTGNGQDLATHDDAVRAVLRTEAERFRAAERAVTSQVKLQELVEKAELTNQDRNPGSALNP